MGLVLLAMGLVFFCFEDKLASRAALRIRPLEVFLLLWQLRGHPRVLRLAAPYFCFMFVWNTAYVFMDNYLTSRFAVGTFGNALLNFLIGIVLVFASAVLVGAVAERFAKRAIVMVCALVMVAMSLLFVLTPFAGLSYAAAPAHGGGLCGGLRGAAQPFLGQRGGGPAGLGHGGDHGALGPWVPASPP